jgi:DNA-binding transcriptional LysR family regulator
MRDDRSVSLDETKFNVAQLRAIAAIARKKSLGKAAASIGVTKSTIHERVATLQNVLGLAANKKIKFYSVQGKHIVFTNLGKEIGHRAAAIVQACDGLCELAQKKPLKDLHGIVRIGGRSTPLEFILPPIMESFHKNHPRVRFVVSMQSDAMSEEVLLQGNLDFIAASRPLRSAYLRGTACSAISFSILIPPRLVNEIKKLKWDNLNPARKLRFLAKQEFISPGDASDKWIEIEKCFKRKNLELHVPFSGGGWQMVKRLVAKDWGVGVVPRICVSDADRKSGMLILDGSSLFGKLNSPYQIVYRTFPGQSLLQKEFLDHFLRSTEWRRQNF